MLFTSLFHVPRDSVTAPDATRSGVLSGTTSGVGLGEGDGLVVESYSYLLYKTGGS